jgi:DNA-binding transcriptional MerR regulator
MNEPAFPGFDDGKEPEAMRTIGEVTRALGIRQHVLRYWEEQFPMLKPVKRSGGRRYYRPEDVALVAQIDRLVHREGYTLRGARLALEGKAKAPATDDGLGESAEAPVLSPQIRTRLKALREDLAVALRHA